MQNQTNAQPPIPDTQPGVSLRGLNSPWFRRHALFGPFGIFIAAWLMCWSDTGTWRIWTDWSAMSDLADLAVIIYGMAAVVIERGLIIMFWALERRKQMREEFRAQVIAEARTEILSGVKSEIRSEILSELRSEVRSEILSELRSKTHLRGDDESTSDWLDRMARELEDSGKK